MKSELLIFMIISCFSAKWKAIKGATIVTDEHLFVVGNNVDGNGMLTVTSKLAHSVTTFTLNGHSISSACGTHPSRCRELMVQSTRLSDLITKHIVMIPLENGLQLLEFYHNGTSNELSITSQHSLMFSGISGSNACSSLNMYQIGTAYYVPCITRETLYICALTLNGTVISQSTIQSCQQNLMLDIGAAGFTNLSNIVLSDNTYVPQQHLLFLLQNGLYSLFPITGFLSFIGDFSRLCSQINQVLLSPKGNGELLLYCRDHTSIVYSTDTDQIVNLGGLGNVQYPCSPSAEFIIHLNQNRMELSYKVRNNGSDTVQISLSPTISSAFHSGICVSSDDHHLFAYTDQSVGVFLFNATSKNFTVLPNTCCCGTGDDCELILVYNNQYLVVRNREERRVSVHDIQQGRGIIVLQQDRLVSLLSLIHDIQVVHIPTEPTTTSTDPMNTLPSDTTDDNGQFLSQGAVAAIVVICIVIVILFTAITVVTVIGVVLRRHRHSAKYCHTQVHGRSADAAVQAKENNEEAEVNGTSLNEAQPAVNSDDECIQLLVIPAASAATHGTEEVESTVDGEPDTKTNFQTEDTEIPAEISPKESDISTKVEDEAADTSNTQHLKSDRTVDEEEFTKQQSSTIAADKDEDEASDTDTAEHSQSSSAPKTVQQRIKGSVSANSQVAVSSEEKTDSLYPLRTHFMQEKGSTSKDVDVTTVSEES